MISTQDCIDQFKSLIGSTGSWAKLVKSQFVEHIAIFQSWALRSALWRVERAVQEFFLSTAINDSSIMAHAENREYLPRKTTPSKGLTRITNNGASSVAIPSDTVFLSSPQVDYLIRSAVNILPGGFADVEMSQLSKQTPLTVSITEETPFIEILFPAEMNGKITDFDVYLDMGAGFEKWVYARLFQNSASDAKVYDEFYSHTNQTGIRFGNAIFGMIPPFGSTIHVDYWTSEGSTSLVAGQPLQLVSDILDFAGEPADLTVVTLESIDGGGARESTSEMRKNLHYWPRYNKKLVWDDDYVFYLKNRIAGISWMKCWGEGDQEQETGFDVQNINKIFISGYAADNADLSVDVLAALADVPLLNRKFAWVAPIQSTFTVSITGKVSRSMDISTAIDGIKTVLEDSYGAGSMTREESINFSDLYDKVRDTKYFNDPGAHYQIVLAGTTVPTQLKEMVSIDIESSVFDLTYP